MQSTAREPLRSVPATPTQVVICTALERDFATYFAQHELRSIAIHDASRPFAAWIRCRPAFFLCDFAPAKRNEPLNGYALLRSIRRLEPDHRSAKIILMADAPHPFAAAWAVERLGADRVIARSPRVALDAILGRDDEASQQETDARHDLHEVDKLFREFAGPAASQVAARVTDDLRDAFALIDHFRYAQLLANELTSEYMRGAFLESAKARIRCAPQWPSVVDAAEPLPLSDALPAGDAAEPLPVLDRIVSIRR